MSDNRLKTLDERYLFIKECITYGTLDEDSLYYELIDVLDRTKRKELDIFIFSAYEDHLQNKAQRQLDKYFLFKKD